MQNLVLVYFILFLLLFFHLKNKIKKLIKQKKVLNYIKLSLKYTIKSLFAYNLKKKKKKMAALKKIK